MNIPDIIILICFFLSNICFLICGYKLGTDKQIITLKDNQEIKVITKEKQANYEEEEASFLTPEEEIVLEEKYKKELEKARGESNAF